MQQRTQVIPWWHAYRKTHVVLEIQKQGKNKSYGGDIACFCVYQEHLLRAFFVRSNAPHEKDKRQLLTEHAQVLCEGPVAEHADQEGADEFVHQLDDHEVG